MERIEFEPDFASWQKAARHALSRLLPPEQITWRTRSTRQTDLDLFAAESNAPVTVAPTGDPRFRVPREFIATARQVSCHGDESRWNLLYRVLWRLTQEQPHLLEIATDPDVIELRQLEKAVGRDVHKMRAFVRFREVAVENGRWFVAWFEPQHHIVELNASFFVDRFASMCWSILTPDRCAHWDQKTLTFTDGVTRDQAPSGDDVEGLWRTYYRNIFNPARVKIAAMKKEMAPYYWRNLPEAQDIPELLASAANRTELMVADSRAKSPAPEVYGAAPVPVTNDWRQVEAAAKTCQACPLWRNATCTVFGAGPLDAKVVVVGEQPGDQEDRTGQPFVGPAGKLLDRALVAAGVDRSTLYVTNAVKHFKWEPRGKRRLHQTPNSREVAACRPWMEKEIALVRPELIVCLGGTAVESVVGERLKVTKERGRFVPTSLGVPALITLHPSALLRQPDQSRAEADFDAFVADLSRINQRS
ncbi:MAG: UdgX family uracil-DNA binding protein [Opitutus sp.]